MAGETRFVDVTYRGLKVALKAKLVEQEGPQTGFIEVEAPLPVGTRLILLDGTSQVTARVTGVVEQEAGAKSPPGMRISWADGAEARKPEPAPEPEPVPVPEPEPVAAAPEPADDAATASTPPAEEGAPDSRRARRKTRKTQIGPR